MNNQIHMANQNVDGAIITQDAAIMRYTAISMQARLPDIMMVMMCSKREEGR